MERSIFKKNRISGDPVLPPISIIIIKSFILTIKILHITIIIIIFFKYRLSGFLLIAINSKDGQFFFFHFIIFFFLLRLPNPG
jgi:hypothetical protein